MGFMEMLFGRGHHGRRSEISKPPRDVDWHCVRPRASAAPVQAWEADTDGVIEKSTGSLKYRRGDFIVEYTPDDMAVVERSIFQRTYRPQRDGRFVKRTDILFRYFTLPYEVTVQTQEGPMQAKPGDWIMQGVDGEIWPIEPARAREKYEPA